MKIRRLLIACIGVLSAAMLMAQVVPPPAHDADWDVGYQQGFGDGTTAATQPAPAWPADVVYTPDKTYRIAPAGSDVLSNGSLARPFATIKAALAQIHSDRAGANPPKLAEIAYLASGSYTQTTWLSEDNLLIDSYGAANPEQRATITSPDLALGRLSGKSIHLQNLRLIADPVKGGNYGLYVNGGDDITMDYCEVDGFAMNVDLIGPATHVRLYHNFIANAWTSNLNTESCSGLYTECVSPDVECNILYHNGWRAPFDLTNAQAVQMMMFRHGWYENPGNGNAVAGIDKFNLYMRNAATGHQCRTGGSAVLWDIFWDNGNAADVFTGPGFKNNLGGEVGYCAIFGSLTNDFASWGGGVAGQSVADNFHDLLFAGSSTMQLPHAISIQWNASSGGPLPANTKATISNCRGIWAAGDVSISNGRTDVVTNVNIRKPNPGEHVPSLLDYFATTDDASTAALLRANLHQPKYSAQAVIQWLERSLPGT